MHKIIVTAAITGSIHTPSMSPHLPVTPDQIADEALRAFDAGAAVAHIHARDPEKGAPSADVELYQEIASKVKSRCNMVLCITTGGGLGMTAEQRTRAIPILKPELASFNSGSLNFALHPSLNKYRDFQFQWEPEFLAGTEDMIFPNTFKSLRGFAKIFEENSVQPELEVYDVGMLNNVAYLLNNSFLKRPIYIQFVLGILGGIPPTADNVLFLRNTAKELLGDFTWSVCAAGRTQFNMCTLSLLLGGNVRVGLEDNLYLEKGVRAKSNAEQVEKIIRIARELGLEPASPDEAREILNLKGLEKVAF
ncbi:MAG: 3-keto-5-aminohexanoate cleavage protein [Desulfobacteraceae bacterium]|jgi:uncharacterized protein (DUF849 family)